MIAVHVSCSVRSRLFLEQGLLATMAEQRLRLNASDKLVTREPLSRICVRLGHNPLTEVVRDLSSASVGCVCCLWILLGPRRV